MTNSGGVPGVPHNPKPSPAEVMAHYDILPRQVREAVANSALDWDVRAIAKAMRSGRSASDMVAFIAHQDAFYLARLEEVKADA